MAIFRARFFWVIIASIIVRALIFCGLINPIFGDVVTEVLSYILDAIVAILIQYLFVQHIYKRIKKK